MRCTWSISFREYQFTHHRPVIDRWLIRHRPTTNDCDVNSNNKQVLRWKDHERKQEGSRIWSIHICAWKSSEFGFVASSVQTVCDYSCDSLRSSVSCSTLFHWCIDIHERQHFGHAQSLGSDKYVCLLHLVTHTHTHTHTQERAAQHWNEWFTYLPMKCTVSLNSMTRLTKQRLRFCVPQIHMPQRKLQQSSLRRTFSKLLLPSFLPS